MMIFISQIDASGIEQASGLAGSCELPLQLLQMALPSRKHSIAGLPLSLQALIQAA
jgi:hypothetical protein